MLAGSRNHRGTNPFSQRNRRASRLDNRGGKQVVWFLAAAIVPVSYGEEGRLPHVPNVIDASIGDGMDTKSTKLRVESSEEFVAAENRVIGARGDRTEGEVECRVPDD